MAFDDLAKRMKDRHGHVDLEHPPQPVGDVEAVRRHRRRLAKVQLSVGAGLAALGVLITAFTYDSASSSGGTYLIAYGPIIAGALTLLRGFVSLVR